MDNRYCEFVEIIAAPGRGKTHQLIQILETKLNAGERSLVIVPDGSEPAWFNYPTIFSDDLEEKFNPNFKGILCIEYEEKLTLPFVYKLFKEGKLKDLNFVLDDPFYCDPRPEPEIRKILARKRQYMIDCFSNAHSYDRVPPLFFSYITIFGLGYTETGIVNRREQLEPDYTSHVQKRGEVNAIANVEKDNINYHHFQYYRRDGKNI